jgi:clostripain
MYYSDADCDLEPDLIADVAEMMDGLVPGAAVNLILLIDRNPGFSSDASVIGQDFSDTRLYRLLPGSLVRLNGLDEFPEIRVDSDYEANMGDPATLRKFIEFCKAHYPADHYALFFSNHGGGARAAAGTDRPKHVCFDDTSGGDCLYTAEVTDGLSAAHSVDLIAFDACLMGTAEVAYQYRPGNGDFSAGYMVASGPSVWGYGFPYTAILERLKPGGGDNGSPDSLVGGNEAFIDPAAMDAPQFGAVIVEEQSDSTAANPAEGTSQQLSLYDLSAIGAAKAAIDALAVQLASDGEKADLEALRGSGSSVAAMAYFNPSDGDEWLAIPYFDLYDLALLLESSVDFGATAQGLATTLKNAVAAVVVYSFGNAAYSGFVPGSHGISVFFPDGDRAYISTIMWDFQWWYNAIDTAAVYSPSGEYGKLAWCIDGADAGANAVGNWFELLDSWFDTGNGASGGLNGYQW